MPKGIYERKKKASAPRLCACGCGKEVLPTKDGKRNAIYAHSGQPRKGKTHTEQALAYYRENKELVMVSRRLRCHNVSDAVYRKRLADCEGRCEICRQKNSTRAGVEQRLSLDHDHACCRSGDVSCGKCFRGLLCNNCNNMLGRAHDSVAVLLSAAAYLTRWNDRPPAHKVEL